MGHTHTAYILLQINFGIVKKALSRERFFSRAACLNHEADRKTRVALDATT